MKQIFLTSSVHAVAADIASKLDLTKGNRLVFIDTAAELEQYDRQWLVNDRKAPVDAGFDVTDYTITGKSIDQIKEDLKDFDYIYVEGGNTTYLLQQSQKSGFFTLIQDSQFTQGKTYIGTSAGSIIAGPRVPSYLFQENTAIQLDSYDGYGLVDFTILPHWGSEDFRDLYLNGRLEVAFTLEQNPLITLTDSQYIHLLDGQIEFVDIKNRYTGKASHSIINAADV